MATSDRFTKLAFATVLLVSGGQLALSVMMRGELRDQGRELGRTRASLEDAVESLNARTAASPTGGGAAGGEPAHVDLEALAATCGRYAADVASAEARTAAETAAAGTPGAGDELDTERASAARAEAEALFADASRRRRWSSEDRDRLRVLFGSLTPDQAASYSARLARLLNTGALTQAPEESM